MDGDNQEIMESPRSSAEDGITKQRGGSIGSMDMQDDFDEPLTAEEMQQEIARMAVEKEYYKMKQEVSQLKQQSRISQGLSPSSKGTSRSGSEAGFLTRSVLGATPGKPSEVAALPPSSGFIQSARTGAKYSLSTRVAEDHGGSIHFWQAQAAKALLPGSIAQERRQEQYTHPYDGREEA
jgi:hypothetical protein